MIVNNFVISYIMLTLISLGLCLPAAFVAWRMSGKWKPGIGEEERGEIEKKVYLVISLLSLGFFLRLFLIPLWFLTLQSLIPSVPGAMCLAGVHLLDKPVSFTATTLKLFIPLIYIYWMVLNSLDRRIETQPFMKLKLMLVLPLAMVMLAESGLDCHFLYAIKPRIVSCCTTLFDQPRQQALMIIRQAKLAWMYSFYASLAVCLAVSAGRFSGRPAARMISALFSVLALVSLALFLHTRVSPMLLETPFHQCIFCLWQGMPDIAAASFALVLGLWLNFVCAMIPDVRGYPAARKLSLRISRWATALYLTGAVWITARCAFKYFAKL